MSTINQALKDHLVRQLKFLTTSCITFDAGDREEALRIATAIRVIFYDTTNSHSILYQMGVKASIQLISTTNPTSTANALAMLPTIDFGSFFPITLGKHLDYTPPSVGALTQSVEDWWNQPALYTNQVLLTRGRVVLAAAHKDGGAHVDLKKDLDDINALKDGQMFNRIIKQADGTQKEERIADHHFALLRHFAAEILASPDIQALQT